MLLASETFFFAEAQMRSPEYRDGLVTAKEPLRLARDGSWHAVSALERHLSARPRLHQPAT